MFKITKQQQKLLIAVSLVLIGAAALLLRTSCGTSKVDNSQVKRCRLEKPAEWATPIIKDGLPNFHKVSQDLYRGAQPTAAGVRQ